MFLPVAQPTPQSNTLGMLSQDPYGQFTLYNDLAGLFRSRTASEDDIDVKTTKAADRKSSMSSASSSTFASLVRRAQAFEQNPY